MSIVSQPIIWCAKTKDLEYSILILVIITVNELINVCVYDGPVICDVHDSLLLDFIVAAYLYSMFVGDLSGT